MGFEKAAKSRWWIWVFIPMLNWVSWLHLYLIIPTKKYIVYTIIYLLQTAYLIAIPNLDPNKGLNNFRGFVVFLWFVLWIANITQAFKERKILLPFSKPVQKDSIRVESRAEPQQSSVSKSIESSTHKTPTELDLRQNTNVKENSSSMTVGLGILCFIIPFLGIFVWSANKDTKPKKARAALWLTIYPSLAMLYIPFIGNRTASTNTGVTHRTEEIQGVSTTTTQAPSREWWEVTGTLHNASALEWQDASYANKLATCGDLMVIYWENGVLSERISRDFESRNMDRVRFWADSLVIVLDIVMERFPEEEENERMFANQSVPEMAALILMTSNWIKRN